MSSLRSVRPVVRRAEDLPADAFELAASLADLPGVTVCRGLAATYVAAAPVETSDALDPEPGLTRAAMGTAGEAPRWLGLIPYEACREVELAGSLDPRDEPLLVRPLWLRYGAVARVTDRVELLGDDPSLLDELHRRLKRPPLRRPPKLALQASPEPAAEHAARIRVALEEIGNGNVYQVNLARRFELSVTGSAAELLRALGRGSAPPHGFSLELGDLLICAASPELCLLLEPDGRVLTRPIKGTRPRGGDLAEDTRLAEELDQDPKERAELSMIIDVERNDLGRVARTGSVRLSEPPSVIALASVHHRLAGVEAQVPDTLGRTDLLRAVLPSGSVTGAPKRQAMRLIARLERWRRGLYTGVVGALRWDGGLELGMAIRTVSARGGLGHYFSGGGIVADSIPERELEETLWKAEALFRVGR